MASRGIMVSETAASDWRNGAWPLVARLSAADGTAAHPWAKQLGTARAARRDLSDAVHALAMLHGHQPGMADHALTRRAQADADAWLAEVSAAFAAERAVLAMLVAAAGPLPSTPGHAGSEAAILGQRHALDMLARSDRCGCATGAVAALLVDWPAVRLVLDQAGRCFGVPVPPPQLPVEIETATTIATLGGTPAIERAISFGAQQLLAQHRGLWSLLEARAEARDRS